MAVRGVPLPAGLTVTPVIVTAPGPEIVRSLVSMVLTIAAYPLFRWARRRGGVTRQTCVCVGSTYEEVKVSPQGALTLARTGVVIETAQTSACVERYQGRLLAFARSRLSRKEEAEDLVQDAMVGGLLLSQILTLYTTPVIYVFFDRLGQRFARRKPSHRPTGNEPQPEPGRA